MSARTPARTGSRKKSSSTGGTTAGLISGMAVQTCSNGWKKKRFFDLPASINHHLNYSGGLCEHTVNVVENAVELCNTNHAFECCDQEAVIVAALLHDICKANKYLSDGIGYHYQDTGMLGHGEESVIFAQKFVKLTDREIMAIRWHMGAYSGEKDWNTLGKVYDQYPEAICLHLADMIATHYDER